MSELPGAGELVVLPAGREAAKFKVHKQVRTFNSRLLRLHTGQQNSKNRRQKNVRAGQRKEVKTSQKNKNQHPRREAGTNYIAAYSTEVGHAEQSDASEHLSTALVTLLALTGQKTV